MLKQKIKFIRSFGYSVAILGEGLFKIEDPQDDEDGLFLYGGEQILDEAINMINVFGEHDDKLTELGLQ